MRRAGTALMVSCAGYIGVVAVALGDTAVGPLAHLPADGGNGQIAGLPQDAGTVPGLLVPAPHPDRVPTPARRAARPVVHAPPTPPVATGAQLAKLATGGPGTRHPGATPQPGQKPRPGHAAGHPRHAAPLP